MSARSISVLVNAAGVPAPAGASDDLGAEGAEVVRFGGDGGVAEAQTAARASADVLVFVGAGTRLRAGALGRLRDALAFADLAYADEAVLGQPVRKPGWSPVLLLGTNFVGCPWAVRRERFIAAGGLRGGFGAAAELDLLLRLDEAGVRTERIPEVLADSPPPRGEDAEAKRRAVDEACRRRGITADVVPSERAGVLRVRPRSAEPRVTAVVPTRDRGALLARCLEGLDEGTDYPDLEVVVVDNGSTEPEALAVLDATRHRVVRWPGAFDYAAIHNRVVADASGELVLLLNNDTEVLERGWLRALVADASLPGVGVVGAWLLYPDGRIQHAGIVLRPIDYPHHLLHGLDESSFRHRYFGAATCEVTAVTGACMLVRKDLFLAAGGFDRRFRIAFNDVDLCLRLRAAGASTLIEPAARLVHHESATREPLLAAGESVLFRARWRHRFPAGDPYYHPALDPDRADFSERCA